VQTAGPPARIRITPERDSLRADGEDLVYCLVEAVDAGGVVRPLAEQLVRFQVEGPGALVAAGNGNPPSQEEFSADRRHLFYGKAVLVLRSIASQTGRIEVTAAGSGLEQGSAVMTAK